MIIYVQYINVQYINILFMYNILIVFKQKSNKIKKN